MGHVCAKRQRVVTAQCASAICGSSIYAIATHAQLLPTFHECSSRVLGDLSIVNYFSYATGPMRSTLVFLALASSAFAQSIAIFAPSANATVAAGSNLVVDVEKKVGDVLSVSHCTPAYSILSNDHLVARSLRT